MHTHTYTRTHTYKTVYIRIKLYKSLYIYQLCNNYHQSLFPFSVVASSQVFGSQYGRLEKPRGPRKEAGPHTHRTNIDRGPEARWRR